MAIAVRVRVPPSAPVRKIRVTEMSVTLFCWLFSLLWYGRRFFLLSPPQDDGCCPKSGGFLFSSGGWWIRPGVLVAIEWPQGCASWATQESYRHPQQYEASPIASPLLGDQNRGAFFSFLSGQAPLASARHVLAGNSLVRLGCPFQRGQWASS